MPTLDFKGKQFIYAHHLTAPFRPLVPVAEKSLLPDGKPGGKGREPDMDGNLIIHGDNLHALKALLPRYAGRVNCIFIDPPYNTGGDWCYDDRVNSPLMREWIKDSANPVDKDDLERHDKWLCMMWPRIQLLRELLSDDGILVVAIDDNEQHRLACLIDEVFGEDRKIAYAPWKSDPSGGKQKSGLRIGHEYLLIYRKSSDSEVAKEETELAPHSHEDQYGTYLKGRELLKWGAGSQRADRETMWFPLKAPDGSEVLPIRNDGKQGRWRMGDGNSMIRKILTDPAHAHWEMRPYDEGVAVDGKTSRWVPYEKIRDNSKHGALGSWLDGVGANSDGTEELKRIFGSKPFDTPKPTLLLEWVMALIPQDDALVLDSFAGSGTTAHAVLAQNRKDGGNRKFILVECEDYADQLTAERVRRVIQGYEFTGTQREELHREPITFTSLRKADKILERVAGYEMTDGHRFDKIKSEVKDGVLTVTGEKAVKERTEGLGGSFTYCELGPAVEIESFLTGEALPAYAALASYVFYTATGQTLEKVPKARADGFIGETDLFRIHLHYQPDLEWLRSNDSALNESLAEAVAKANTTGKRCLVFATAKFMSQKDLTGMKIEFCQIPFAIHRLTGTSA